MKKLLSLLFLLPNYALAQSVLQAGPIAPYRVPMYVGAFGQSQAILQDSGPASGAGTNVGLSELLLSVRGTGIPPYANAGSGPFGANDCNYDAPVTNPTGYHYICFSPNAQGGESIIAGFGGATTALPLQFVINGVVTPINSTGNILPTNNIFTGINAFGPVTGSSTGVLTTDGYVVGAQNTTLTGKTIYQSTLGGALYFDNIRSALAINPGSTNITNNAFGAYIVDNQPFGAAPGIAGTLFFGNAIANVPGSQIWGESLALNDNVTGGCNNASLDCFLNGIEVDFTVTSAVNNAVHVQGPTVILNAPNATIVGNGFQVSARAGQWTNGYVSDNGAAGTALNVGSLNATATANGPSQPIAFQAFNGSSAAYTVKLQVVADTLNFTDTEAACGVALSAAAGGAFLQPAGGASCNISLAAGASGAVFLQSLTVLSKALTYGGVTLANSVTGTGSMVLSASPTFTGTITSPTVTLTAVAPTVSAGQIGYGSTVTANTNCGTLASSAGCVVINVAGTVHYIPYY